MTKDVLSQYVNMKQETIEIREKIARLEKSIARIEKNLIMIEQEGTVKDKVKGGEGGNRPYVIEGFPMVEYERNRTNLMMQKLLLSQRKTTLEILEFDIMQKTGEIETFIASISDSAIRRIINLRFIEDKSWNEVADAMGGGNSEDSVRMMFTRFMEKA